MYPVSSDFHSLAIQDHPKTRIRIYFISDSVDCTDDEDVETNGTLLVGAIGDTDSNGRIASGGVVFSEFFNPDKNATVGRCVSSQIEANLLNTDGGLTGFAFGRCKVYLDVYDTDSETWLTCPMGVYIIEQPSRTNEKTVFVHGFDQMSLLDSSAYLTIESTRWGPGHDLYSILSALFQGWFTISSGTYDAMANKSIPYNYGFPANYTENTTCKDVLQLICEASGTIARFDRNGALDLKWFSTPQIGGYDVSIDADASGNQALALDIAEYTVAQYGTIIQKYGTKTETYTDPGGGDNEYTIVGNPFLNPSNQGSIGGIPIAYILAHLSALGAYNPINARLIMDWSIESGDILHITRNQHTYTFPIFQQTMIWRGGNVISDCFSDGDPIRPFGDSTGYSDSQTDDVLFIIKAGESYKYNMMPGESIFIVTSGSPASSSRTGKELVIAFCDSSGTVTHKHVIGTSGFTYTDGGYSLTIGNTSSSANDVHGIIKKF